MINTILNALPSGADRALMTIGGAIGAAFSFAFGDVKPLIVWLCVFVTGDMITGILCAIRNDCLSGKKLFWGSTRKVLMFCFVALAHGLDEMLVGLIYFPFVQSVVLVAYTASELGSIIKNVEHAGFGGIVPPILRCILFAINDYLDEKAKNLPFKKEFQRRER